MGLFFLFSEDGHGFYFFIFQKKIEEGKWSVRLFCLFIFICKFFGREGGRGFSFSFSKLMKGKGDVGFFFSF